MASTVTTAHVLGEAAPFAPRETGALAGWAVPCTCGFVNTSSLSARHATQGAEAHLAWAARTGR